MREILVYNKQAKDETSCEICTQQTNKQEKKQCTRFLRNKQTNQGRKSARESCVGNNA